MPMKNFILLVVYLLVPLASNFIKGWTPYQIIYKVFDHKSRQLFCRAQWTLMISKQNKFVRYTEHFVRLKWRLKKSICPANCVSRATHICWIGIRLKGNDTLWNFSFREFHEMQFQSHFMKHEILLPSILSI